MRLSCVPCSSNSLSNMVTNFVKILAAKKFLNPVPTSNLDNDVEVEAKVIPNETNSIPRVQRNSSQHLAPPTVAMSS